MSNSTVPFNDLTARFRARHRSLLEAADRVLSSGWVVLGPEVEQFEESFASYIGADTCVGVATGTDAIELGLRAVGVCENSRVGLVANAAMYCYTALQAIGAVPIFMDVDSSTRCASLAEVERVIAKGVDYIVVTHLYGCVTHDMPAIAQRCNAAGVVLFEDCAQAHGARLGDRSAGMFGKAASFSFYPTKNLGGIGDGGAVVSQDRTVTDTIRQLRQYGWTEKYKVDLPHGTNSRLDELQASFLNVFLADLDQENAARRSIANRYTGEIVNDNVRTPDVMDESHVAHLYVIECTDRDGLRKHLKEQGIMTDVHYPIPDHHQLVELETGRKHGALAVTERLCREVLSLPCFPSIAEEDVSRVVAAVNSWRI